MGRVGVCMLLYDTLMESDTLSISRSGVILLFVFIITDKANGRRGGGRRCRCYERHTTTYYTD